VKRIEGLLQALAGALALAGAVALAGIFVIVFAAVPLRYLWGRPLAATEELSGLLMTTAVFALLPLTILKGIHVRVTVLSDLVRGPASLIVHLAGQAVFVVFAAVFVGEAWAIAAFTDRLNLLSEQARLPLAPFLYLATAATAIAGLCGLWRVFRPAEKPAEQDRRP
jgi:TRAP-type mannitol/chloroaromatic compound transport system permease small subunit